MGKLVKVFLGSVGVGLVLGLGVGSLLGTLSPGLIRMFMGEHASGSAVGDGAALGLLNGGIYGFFGGAILVVAIAVVQKKSAE